MDYSFLTWSLWNFIFSTTMCIFKRSILVSVNSRRVIYEYKGCTKVVKVKQFVTYLQKALIEFIILVSFVEIKWNCSQTTIALGRLECTGALARLGETPSVASLHCDAQVSAKVKQNQRVECEASDVLQWRRRRDRIFQLPPATKTQLEAISAYLERL